MSLAGVQPVAAAGRPGDARAVATLLAVGRRIDPHDPKLAWQAASKTVAQLFFAPLLAEMRKLPFGREFVNGGRTEEIFGELLDLRIADSVAAAEYSGLTRQLAEKLQAGRNRAINTSHLKSSNTVQVQTWQSP